MSNDIVNLQLRKFNIREMDINAKVGVIGKPGTGKSTIIEDILYHHRYIPMGMALVGTEEGVEQFQRLMPDSYIYNEYNQKAVDKLVTRQKKAKRRHWKHPNAFLVLDDVMDDKKWLKSKTTRGIFKNGRHWALLFILAMQYSMDISPELRTCIDYIFLLRENIPKNRLRLYEHYCGVFPNYEMFEQVFNACTENYECLVIKNRSISNKVEDVVFWYKADLHEPFKLGSKRFWSFHKQNYNKHYESDEDDDMNNNKEALIRRQRKPSKYIIEKFSDPEYAYTQQTHYSNNILYPPPKHNY